jgi:hypothetical protein
VTGLTFRQTGNPHTLSGDSRCTLHVGSIEVPLQEQVAVARVPSGPSHAQLVWVRKSALVSGEFSTLDLHLAPPSIGFTRERTMVSDNLLAGLREKIPDNRGRGRGRGGSGNF